MWEEKLRWREQHVLKPFGRRKEWLVLGPNVGASGWNKGQQGACCGMRLGTEWAL